MRKHLGIEFGKVFEGTFPEFKELFGSNHIFKKFQPKQREQELKKAYEIASKKITPSVIKEIEVKDAKIENPDGDTSTATRQSKKDNSAKAE